MIRAAAFALVYLGALATLAFDLVVWRV